MMAMFHRSLGSLNVHLHAPFRQVIIRSMQYLLEALEYEEASNYSTSTKWNFCNFLFGCHLPWMPGVTTLFFPSARPWSHSCLFESQ